MPEQLSMMDALCPPPPPPAPIPWVEPVKREVMTRAYGEDHILKIRENEPDPIEIEVRGIPCVIKFDFGFNTYAIQPPGSPFWSGTGFRSWTNGIWQTDHGIVFDGSVDDIRGLIEDHIDTPVKKMGLGGKLVRWWPTYINRWRGDLSWRLTYPRDKMWTQWGPERHAEIWAEHDARISAAEARMWAEGIDPNDVDKPPHHKGPWPRFSEAQA